MALNYITFNANCKIYEQITNSVPVILNTVLRKVLRKNSKSFERKMEDLFTTMLFIKTVLLFIKRPKQC